MAPTIKMLKKQPIQASAACRQLCVAGALKSCWAPGAQTERHLVDRRPCRPLLLCSFPAPKVGAGCCLDDAVQQHKLHLLSRAHCAAATCQRLCTCCTTDADWEQQTRMVRDRRGGCTATLTARCRIRRVYCCLGSHLQLQLLISFGLTCLQLFPLLLTGDEPDSVFVRAFRLSRSSADAFSISRVIGDEYERDGILSAAARQGAASLLQMLE